MSIDVSISRMYSVVLTHNHSLESALKSQYKNAFNQILSF